MNSPFTGKEMKRVYEKRIWNFRGEQFEYIHSAWLCEDTGEQFTDDKSDTAAFVQVTNQYRAKYGIPYTDEIISVRNRYGISATKMSLLLGIGINQYRLYEQGEVPSISNGRMIRSVMNPKVMLEMIESSKNELSKSDYDKLTSKINYVIAATDTYKFEQYEIRRIYNTTRSLDNGFAPLSLFRLKNIMLYILNRCNDMWYTKMNKILFYIDFISYREHGMAVTGLSYRALDYGPVPDRWDRVYSEFPEISQELCKAGDFDGTILRTDTKADTSALSSEELDIIDTVCTNFGQKTAREMSRISHDETAWLKYKEQHERIPLYEAYTISAI